MAENNPNPQQQEASADPADVEGLDAAAAAFAAPHEESDSEGQPDDQAEPEAKTEAEEADPSEADATDELVEVEFEGKTYSVPQEIQKGLLRQADYSRKMNEASTAEKTYKARLEGLDNIDKLADKRADSIAAVKQLDAQIKAYEGINWAEAKAKDPANAALAAVELMTLQQQRVQAISDGEKVASELKTERETARSALYADMAKVLDKEFKDWRGEGGKALTEYAAKAGIPFEELRSVTNPQVILALEKARKYDALQTSMPAVKNKVQNASPVTKPGSRQAVPTAKAQAMASHKKSGSIDSATAAFEALG